MRRIQYQACHKKVRQLRGKASSCIFGCAHKVYIWANLTGDYQNVNDYASMCARCHIRYDRARSAMELIPNVMVVEDQTTLRRVSFEKAQAIRRMAIDLGDRLKRKVTIDEMLGLLIKNYQENDHAQGRLEA